MARPRALNGIQIQAYAWELLAVVEQLEGLLPRLASLARHDEDLADALVGLTVATGAALDKALGADPGGEEEGWHGP